MFGLTGVKNGPEVLEASVCWTKLCGRIHRIQRGLEMTLRLIPGGDVERGSYDDPAEIECRTA